MDKADIQEVKDGRLIRELEGLDAAEAGVDVHASRQLGQQCDGVLNVAVQVHLVLLADMAPEGLLTISLQQMVCHQRYQAVLRSYCMCCLAHLFDKKKPLSRMSLLSTTVCGNLFAISTVECTCDQSLGCPYASLLQSRVHLITFLVIQAAGDEFSKRQPQPLPRPLFSVK